MMRHFPGALVAILVATPGGASAQTGAQLYDIMASCENEASALWSFLKAEGLADSEGQEGIAQLVMQAFTELPDLAEARAVIAEDPNPNRNPPEFQNLFLCVMKRRFAWDDGAPMLGGPKFAAQQAPAKEPSPLGLADAPADAFKKSEDPDLYWLKADMRTDGQMCTMEGCSALGTSVELRLTIDDAYGARSFDWKIHHSDNHVFSYPSVAGKTYRFELSRPAEKYDCDLSGKTSGVIDRTFATNADLAQSLVMVRCRMNGAGIAEYNRVKAEKAASDALIFRGVTKEIPAS